MPTILGYHLLARRLFPIKQGQGEAKRQAFLLGAQGEDFLRDPPHPFRRQEAPLGAFADYVNALSAAELLAQGTAFAHSHPQKKDLICAYLAGFLCHRAYWEAIGPFFRAALAAYEQTDEPARAIKLDENLPVRMEAVFDILLLRYETGQLPFEVSLKETWPREADVWESVSMFYADGLAQGWTGPVAQTAVLNAMEHRRRWIKVLNNRTTFKRSALGLYEGLLLRKGIVTARMHPLTEPDGFDYANAGHALWRDPSHPQTEREESLFDLFEQAVCQAERADRYEYINEQIKGGIIHESDC